MFYLCSPTESATINGDSTHRKDASKPGFFSSPMTIVLAVWGLMFLGLGIVLAYD